MNNEVEQIISKIVSSEGISILKDSKKFISLFDDLAPELIEERKIFHRGLNDIILNQICEIYSSKENSKLNLLKEFYQRIQKDQGLSQEWSKLIILSFFNALNVKEVNNLNFKIDTPPETISTVDVEPHKMTLKEAEEHYDKKSNEKEIALSDGGLYVGEAVADKPHGHGKCIYKNGDIYVGDWAFGVYNGNGRYTWANGDSCECVWKDGKRNGQGVFCYADEQVWRGEFKLDLFWNGEGIQKLDNGDYYDGCLKNGKREGKGTIYYNDGKKCVGEWRGDFIFEGSGTVRYANGSEFEGAWTAGKQQGKGRYINKDGDKYEGEFKDGKRHGKGSLYLNNGKSLIGIWNEDILYDGHGVEYYSDGKIYDGELKGGKPHGQGKCVYKSGDVYTGTWEYGKYNGKGIYQWKNGCKYIGQWKDGYRNGNGTFYCKEGEWNGEWKNDKMWSGTGTCIYDNGYYSGDIVNGKREGNGIQYWLKAEDFGEIKKYSWSGTFKDDRYWDGFGYDNQYSISQCRYKKGKESKDGCYVATCVYGSYDCSKVWLLRRYRDYKLKSTWYGRIFVKCYYTISPYLVRKFGTKNWFRKVLTKLLDKFTNKLATQGYEDTPYQDM